MDSARLGFALFALAALAGCSATGDGTRFTASASSSGTGTGMGGGTGTGASTGSAGSGGAGGGLTIDAGPIPDGGGGSTGAAEIFGQTATELYRLDPLTNALTDVGPFVGIEGSVIDIALDKNGNMYGTTSDAVYKIDKTTAIGTHLADGSFPNSLSFVPAGTLDPNVEALVGYDTDSNYIRIDTTTGAISMVGPGALGDYASSGDIVSVIGGGTYLTVTGGPGPGFCGDCIVKVDPKTGAVLGLIGSTTSLKHGGVFGLAFWGGSAYGFDDTGKLFQIDLTSGTSTNIPIPNAPSGIVWYGAGSSTSAPLTTQ